MREGEPAPPTEGVPVELDSAAATAEAEPERAAVAELDSMDAFGSVRVRERVAETVLDGVSDLNTLTVLVGDGVLILVRPPVTD